MIIIKSIIVGIVYLYAVIFVIWVQLIGLLFRFFYNPFDLFLLFKLPLLGNLMKEIYESIPRISPFVNICRRV